MKHLNKYKTFESSEEDSKKFFESVLNYDLINDLKELCMDFIDDDYQLNIDYLFRVTPYMSRLFGGVRISHFLKSDEYYWRNLSLFDVDKMLLQLSIQDNPVVDIIYPAGKKIHYRFNLTQSKLTYSRDLEIFPNSNPLNSILGSIKSIYPDETITIKTAGDYRF